MHLHFESLDVCTDRKVNANANAMSTQTQTLHQYIIDLLAQRQCNHIKGALALVLLLFSNKYLMSAPAWRLYAEDIF